MPKQTSIEWLFAHLIPHLDWSKVEDRELFRKLKAEAQQMHKEEIKSAYLQGGTDVHCKNYKGMHEYHQETYRTDTK
jgi:hypothetical protein